MANRSPERLGDFVRRIRKQKNLSLKAVSMQSGRFGDKIADSYISRIENEPRRKVTADRLTALANGLGVPAEELFARAAGLIVPGGKSEEEIRLLAMFKELSPERKADVLEMVDLWHSKESSRRSPRRKSA
jgi:transcriptional regulator with XRE-family HTH domain